MAREIDTYEVISDEIKVNVSIVEGEDFVKLYKISVPEISSATLVLLDSVKEALLREAKIGAEDIFNQAVIGKLKEEFRKKAREIIDKKLPNTPDKTKKLLIGYLIHEMLGLGTLEIPLSDANLEEIVINTSKEPVWVYHKKFGWLKTNITLVSEGMIQNYASIIARRVGRQITTLSPLLDAHLITGDRANATLFPISTKGNTLTIRKFARKPWTIIDFILNNTLTPEVASFIWLGMQYELNMIVAGGTSSGKTSLMNGLMPFIQPNHRIISIEDTRELQLPQFLHWLPLTTRLPNPEGKGEVSMLQLLVNSLRMRPDRIVVGEIRTGRQAEVLFEAMHTGHSVYATLHADTADQVVRRMTNPPINVPPVMLESLDLIVVQYRDRRRGIRRTYQLAELVPTGESGDSVSLKPNVLYRCKPSGEIVAHEQCVKIFDTLGMHTGMSAKELNQDMEKKKEILKWLVENKVTELDNVGKVMAEYYMEPENVIKAADEKKKPDTILRS